MTSNSLSINQKHYLTNSLKSYWWLMLINTIIYFLIGPVAFTMVLNGYRLEERIRERIYEWFYIDGFYAFYVLIMILGVIMGLVMFNYLHHKRQINFYHSLPITRTQHFLQRLGIGAVITFLPLLVICIAMIIIAAVYGGDAGYALQATLGHLGRLFLFFLISYSLTVLAGQLTGNILTHIFMTVLLYFGPTLLYGCYNLLGNTFFNTFYISDQVMERLAHLSPIGYMFSFLDQIGVYTAAEPLIHLHLSGLVSVVLISIAALVLAYILYLKRPSEASGQSVVYACIQQPLKWIVFFMAAVVGGYAFLEVGGRGFMIFGILLFIGLTQMTAEVIYNKDFKAIGKNLKGTLVFAVLFLALIGSLYFDIWGYDRYTPDTGDVQAVQINFSNMGEGLPSYNFEELSLLKEPEQINSVVSLINKITSQEAYYKNSSLYGYAEWGATETSSTIYVKYIMNNGREITRCYQRTPVALYQDEFAKLYNSQEFKRVFYLDQMEKGQLSYVSIDAVGNDFVAATDDYMGFHENISERNLYSDMILEAVRQDIQARQWTSLQRGALYKVNLEWYAYENGGRRYRNLDVAVYAEDTHTLAVIEQLKATHKMNVMMPEDIVAKIDRLEVYHLDDEKIAQATEWSDARELIYTYDVDYDKRLGEKIAEITEPAAIAATLPNVVSINQLHESSAFVMVDYNYVAVAYLKSAQAQRVNDEQDAEDYVVLYYLQDHLPE